MSFQLMADNSINNTLTSEHVYIKGTKISLIPPKDFKSSKNFLGLEHNESGSSIMITEVPAGFSEISKGITQENLLQNGVVAEKIESLTFNQLPAVLVKGTQNSNGKDYSKYILIFGTENESFILNGIFLKNYIRAGEEIKKSMLTSYFDKSQSINPLELLDYSINVNSSKLKFAKFFSNSLIYTVDGLLPTLSEDNTSLMVSKSISKITTEDKEQFAMYRLGQMPYEIKTIVSKTPISINQFNGFEIIAKGVNNATQDEEVLYQTILFNQDFYYIFFGTTNDSTGKSIDDIKEVVRTFRLK
ncbi:MAG TPA: hypothetical protein VLZ75_03790 [Chitinophagales bacterium]|nr:hypothetical protein [Chitinophagales bacterium]